MTGVLGPEPDEDGNPPGRVWFAAVRRGREPRLIEEHFNDSDPDDVRRAAILRVIMMCPGPLSDRAPRWLIAYGKPRYDASAKLKSQR